MPLIDRPLRKLAVAVAIAVAVAALWWLATGQALGQNRGRPPNTPAPTSLSLPFDPEELDISKSLVSPFGLIRHSRDSGIGHGGIDIPINLGDTIFAIADGTILGNDPATDGRGGFDVRILILDGDRPGEGWAFRYEHIRLDGGIGAGDAVIAGQRIGESAITRGNNHLGLEYLFNNYQFTRDHKCWLNHLSVSGNQALTVAFDAIKNTREFLEPWRTAEEEGAFQYRGALDPARFPDGPQLCYPMGTDLRVAN